MRLAGGYLQFISIQTKRDICPKKGNALVTVNEGAVHDQGLEQGSAHFRQVFVVTGLGPEKRAIEKAWIPNADFTAESLDQSCVNLEQFIVDQELYRVSAQAVFPVLRSDPSTLQDD